MKLIPLLLRRIVLAIPMLFAVATLTFLVTRILPGDPIHAIAGPLATPEIIESLRSQYGFDAPLITQFVTYLGDLVRLDLGQSVITGNPVREDLINTLPSTLELIVLSIVLALAIGIAAGAAAAVNRGGAADRVVRSMSSVLVAIPEFWFALVALYVFFFLLGIAPAPVGQIGLSDERPAEHTHAMLIDSVLALDGGAFRASAAHAALPVITLGLILSAPFARLMRSSMIEMLGADYVRFGRSCGLANHVLWRYAARASLPPVVTSAGMIFTNLIGGAVLVEVIFSWGGAAQYAASAVAQNDYNAVTGFVLVAGTISVIVFLLVDVAYMVIDPRVRLAPAPVTGKILGLQRKLAGGAAALRGLRPGTAGMRIARSTSAAGRAAFHLPGRMGHAGADASRALAHGLRERPIGQRARRVANPPLLWGAGIVAFFIICSIVVPAVWMDSPTFADAEVLQSPSLRHPFGTDGSGFDVFARVFAAPRTDFVLAASGVFLGAAVGVALGVIAGMSRGWLGELAMRATDVVQAFPMFILALVLVALSGNNVKNIVLALAFVNAPYFLRLVRSRVLTIRELRFIEAGVALGNPRWRLIAKHVFPNAIGPAIVQLGLSLGYGILAVAGLAFLGVGVSVPTPEWGSMILTGRGNILTGQWWTVVCPGVALVIAVAAFNLLAEGIEQSRELDQPGTRHVAPTEQRSTAALADPAV